MSQTSRPVKVFKDSFKFSRQTFELVYSALLILVIPSLIILNTILLLNHVNKDSDLQLQRKSDMASQIIGQAALTQLDKTEVLQTMLKNMQAARPELTDLQIIKVDATGPKIAADSNGRKAGEPVTNVQALVAVQSKKSVAQLVRNSRGQRAWRVITPITQGGSMVAMASTEVSLADADALAANTARVSFAVLIVSVVAAITLLANHFKFVGYAQLFNKLKEVDQLKTDFLSVATHELKAPMTSIKGYIANVLDGTFGEVNDQVKQNLLVVEQQTERLNGLVTDLLNVSRIEQGKITYQYSDFAPAGVIAPLITQYEERAKAKNITLHYQPLVDSSLLHADQGRYQEIMTNLIDNAVKYSLHGTVNITHEIKDGMIKTSVRDTGIGMNSAERERLFTRFYRVANDKTKTISGTGLGLWIIKQYIEAMGGKIYVDSLEGVGTEFIVWLPQTKTSPSPPA